MSENKYAMLACCKIFIYTDIHIWNEADLKNLYSQISERSKLLGSPQQNYVEQKHAFGPLTSYNGPVRWRLSAPGPKALKP